MVRACSRHYWAKQARLKTNRYLAKNLRSRMYSALKGACKSFGLLDLLGCSMEQFRRHTEVQFKPGMSWDNYGQWHMDHKKPCVKFDLSKPEEQKACFHYSNLQPLWAEENLAKRFERI